MVSSRALNLIMYAKGRYPKTRDVMGDVTEILGYHAGVASSAYSPELAARIVAEDLAIVVQKTCNPIDFTEFLFRLGPGHPYGLLEGMGFARTLIHGLLEAVALGTTTETLVLAGMRMGEPDPELASRLNAHIEQGEAIG